MTDKVACEIYLAMNEDGGWIVTDQEDEALSKLGEDQGGYQARIVRLTVKMAPPVMTEATVDIPDEAGKEIETQVA